MELKPLGYTYDYKNCRDIDPMGNNKGWNNAGKAKPATIDFSCQKNKNNSIVLVTSLIHSRQSNLRIFGNPIKQNDNNWMKVLIGGLDFI